MVIYICKGLGMNCSALHHIYMLRISKTFQAIVTQSNGLKAAWNDDTETHNGYSANTRSAPTALPSGRDRILWLDFGPEFRPVQNADSILCLWCRPFNPRVTECSLAARGSPAVVPLSDVYSIWLQKFMFIVAVSQTSWTSQRRDGKFWSKAFPVRLISLVFGQNSRSKRRIQCNAAWLQSGEKPDDLVELTSVVVSPLCGQASPSLLNTPLTGSWNTILQHRPNSTSK